VVVGRDVQCPCVVAGKFSGLLFISKEENASCIASTPQVLNGSRSEEVTILVGSCVPLPPSAPLLRSGWIRLKSAEERSLTRSMSMEYAMSSME